jgi:hypothetical protein
VDLKIDASPVRGRSDYSAGDVCHRVISKGEDKKSNTWVKLWLQSGTLSFASNVESEFKQ